MPGLPSLRRPLSLPWWGECVVREWQFSNSRGVASHHPVAAVNRLQQKTLRKRVAVLGGSNPPLLFKLLFFRS